MDFISVGFLFVGYQEAPDHHAGHLLSPLVGHQMSPNCSTMGILILCHLCLYSLFQRYKIEMKTRVQVNKQNRVNLSNQYGKKLLIIACKLMVIAKTRSNLFALHKQITKICCCDLQVPISSHSLNGYGSTL